MKRLCFLIDFITEITGHQDEGFESLVDAAEAAYGSGIATVADVGKPLPVSTWTSVEQINTSTEINDLLQLHRDLLLVQRRIVFDEPGMNDTIASSRNSVRFFFSEPGMHQCP